MGCHIPSKSESWLQHTIARLWNFLSSLLLLLRGQLITINLSQKGSWLGRLMLVSCGSASRQLPVCKLWRPHLPVLLFPYPWTSNHYQYTALSELRCLPGWLQAVASLARCLTVKKCNLDQSKTLMYCWTVNGWTSCLLEPKRKNWKEGCMGTPPGGGGLKWVDGCEAEIAPPHRRHLGHVSLWKASPGFCGVDRWPPKLKNRDGVRVYPWTLAWICNIQAIRTRHSYSSLRPSVLVLDIATYWPTLIRAPVAASTRTTLKSVNRAERMFRGPKKSSFSPLEGLRLHRYCTEQ
jgi:hypothetical protein